MLSRGRNARQAIDSGINYGSEHPPPPEGGGIDTAPTASTIVVPRSESPRKSMTFCFPRRSRRLGEKVPEDQLN